MAQYFDANLALRTGVSPSELKLSLVRLRREIEHRLRAPPSAESGAFFVQAARAISNIRGGAHAQLRIECLCDCAYFFYNNGRPSAFLAIISSLDDLVRRSPSPHWARKIAMLGGVAHNDVGNITEALVRFSSALGIAREASDIGGEVSVLCNLGVALIHAGLYIEAIPCLQRAIALHKDHADQIDAIAADLHPRHLECVALSNLAQAHYFMGDSRRALAAIVRCLDQTPEPHDAIGATNHIIRESNYVRVALDLGMIAEARRHTQVCQKEAAICGTRGRLIATQCRALCEVYAGDMHMGFEILERLLDEDTAGAFVHQSTLHALVKAAEHVNQPAKALYFVDRLVSKIRESREMGIHALVSAALGNRGDFAPESDDLRELMVVRANAKARAAELEAIGAHQETLERLAITADLKEEASGGHGHRVGRLASMFAMKVGWSKDLCHSIELAGRLHDIGKIGLPDRLMLKSDTLRDAERRFIATHTRIGAELLGQANYPALRMAKDVALSHHEHWDGSGYPLGIAGERIPAAARIIALADVFDALTHGRPYSPPWSFERAVEEIRERIGTQFDPDLGPPFISFLAELRTEHPDLDAYLGRSTQNTIFAEARARIQRLVTTATEEVRAESEALA